MSIESTEAEPRKLVAYTATAETPQIITSVAPSLSDDNVRVYGISASGMSTLISSDYWSFNAERTELTLTYTAAYAQALILIDPVVEQPLEYTRDTSFLPTVLERQLDQFALSISWIKDRLTNVLNFSETEATPPSGDLGSATDRASKALTFDSSGGLNLMDFEVQVDGSGLSTITPDAGTFAVGNGTVFAAQTPAQVRSTLDLEVGVDLQAYDAQLDAYGSLVKTNGSIATGDGTNLVMQTEASLLGGCADIKALSPAEGQTLRYSSGAWSAVTDTSSDSTVIIKSVSDFGVIDSNKVYLIDGVIDMGSTSIEIPATGIQIQGLGATISRLTSSENTYTMFTSPVGGSGDVFIQSLDIQVTGTGSKVVDLTDSDGSHTFEINDVNFTSCTEIGRLTDFRQFLVQRCFMLSCTGGWEFAGTWAGGARVSTFLVRAFTGTLFKGITGLTFGSRFLSDANIDIPSGSVGYDFTEAMFINDADFNLIAGAATGAGTFVASIDNTSVKSRLRDNSGIENTYIGARWELTATAPTVVGAPGTYYKIAGTTTYTDEQWFDNTTDNAFRYLSDQKTLVEIKGVFAVTGTNGHDIQIKVRKYDDSAGTYSDVQVLPSKTLPSTGAGVSFSVLAYTELDSPNDRIEVWGQNVSNTANFTLSANSILAITERAN